MCIIPPTHQSLDTSSPPILYTILSGHIAPGAIIVGEVKTENPGSFVFNSGTHLRPASKATETSPERRWNEWLNYFFASA